MLICCVALFAGVCASQIKAQIPGFEDAEPSQEAEKSQVKEKPGAKQSDEEKTDQGWLEKHYNKYLGPTSPYRSVILVVLTLVALLKLKKYLSKKLETHVREKAVDPKNVDAFTKVWNGVWKFVIAILAIIAMTGSLKLLGLTAGFIGMMLGWSLQQPVTGLAAWLMIILKKPFQIGDRVIIAGITGDVTSISLTHVVLNQVGGSIGGEERSGRGILIPNAILFQNVIINYTLEQKYMLDEVPVRLTFESDYGRAKEIMISAAREVTEALIKETGESPFVRTEFLDWGLLVRLRYNTIPVQRQEISTRIIEVLLREFRKEYPRVRFAIPSTQIRHRPDSDAPHPQRMAALSENDFAREGE
jgi:small-conductance mechanosensitive channel